MPETLNLNYYYGNEADQYSFYRIPKILLTDHRYKGVSLEAKVLYGLLLDRMGLSARNGWLDDNGRVFLYFTQEEAMSMLDCGKDKATKLFRELEGIGLMERKKQGQGHPARIYVKNFILEPEPAAPVQTAENQQSRPLPGAAVKTAEKPQSAPRKTSGQECGISAPNNTEINKTGIKVRWCTGQLKTHLIAKEVNRLKKEKNALHYIGIAADEAKRCKDDPNHRYPLVEWGITEAQALQICYDRGFDFGGLYKIYHRASCWCCPLQRIGELRKLRQHHPELWARLWDMDNRARAQFGAGPLGQFKERWSIEQLDARFAREETEDGA